MAAIEAEKQRERKKMIQLHLKCIAEKMLLLLLLQQKLANKDIEEEL